jgi:vacuolar protein sorting-associated protein 35
LDSIDFILLNFIEMNKLWVRLQYQGLSKHKQQRELSRKELKILVGTNLVRLSQLDSITLEMYQISILPRLLDEIVGCRDVIAQEYLFDVIIQAFPDEFHLKCLDMYLSAVAQLQPTVNVKQIVIALVDRFSQYSQREDTGIPEDLLLFDVFWEQITMLIAHRVEFLLEDIIALLVSLNSLAVNCYPKKLEYIDRVLGMAHDKFLEAKEKEPDVIQQGETKELFLVMLSEVVNAYKLNLMTILEFPSSKTSPAVKGHLKSLFYGGCFTELLFSQPFSTRRAVAHLFTKIAILNTQRVKTIDQSYFVFGEVCSILVVDQIDGNLFGSLKSRKMNENDFKDERDLPLDWEDAVEEQTLVAKLLHLIKSEGGPDEKLKVLFTNLVVD